MSLPSRERAGRELSFARWRACFADRRLAAPGECPGQVCEALCDSRSCRCTPCGCRACRGRRFAAGRILECRACGVREVASALFGWAGAYCPVCAPAAAGAGVAGAIRRAGRPADVSAPRLPVQLNLPGVAG